MLKRVLSIFIAAVIATTAVLILPQKTNIAQGEDTNATWDNSVHAMEDGQYPSKNMFTLTQAEDEYTMPNRWHISTFNDCELIVDPAHNFTPLYAQTGEPEENKTTMGRGATPSQIRQGIPGNDGHQYETADKQKLLLDYADHNYSYYVELSKNYGDAREPKNIRLATYNYNGIDLTKYQYLRFQLLRENIELVESAMSLPVDERPYAKVMLYDNSGSGKPCVEFDFTDTFLNDDHRACNYLINVSDCNFVVTNVEFHFRTIRRESTDKSSPARVWFDNIRFLKNATHSQCYAYNVTNKQTTFHGCDYHANIQTHIPLDGFEYGSNAYVTRITDNIYSVAEGTGSFVIQPELYNKDSWLQIAFQNSTGVKLSDYRYFRFYMFVGEDVTSENLGEAWPNDDDFRIYFSEYEDYVANTDKPQNIGFVINPQLSKLKGEVRASGWYVCTVPINKIKPFQQGATSFDLNKTIKSISIQLGSMNFTSSTGSLSEKHAFHIDHLEFIGYDYSPNTNYTYQAGHYQMLENFEQTADAKINTNEFTDAASALAMYRPDVYSNNSIESNSGTWLYKYNDSGKISEHYKSYYCSDFNSMVTQGMYADWLRAKSGKYTADETNNGSGNMEAAYNFRTEDNSALQTRDLSKFTHFSLDFTIRPQDNTLGHLTAPGLQGTKETFRIRIRSKSSGGSYLESRLTFTLNMSSDTTGEGANSFYSSNDGIQIFPMEGFIPGRAGLYTCSGSMRITFTLADILARAGEGFDITQTDQIRFEWLKSDYKVQTRDEQEYDHRMTDLFLDNFVGFTPDMMVTVKTQGVPDGDATQPYVFTIIGGDDVTTHVNAMFVLQGNDTEVIYNLPFNSYTIYQSDWAWRFTTSADKMQQTVAQKMATLDKPNGGKFTYKDMVNNNIALSYTVVFTPEKTKSKWLSDTRRVHFKAKN